MKKIIVFISLVFFSVTLSACHQTETYRIGATPVPHSEILDYVKPLLEERGFTYEVVVFTDYVLPNIALDQGDIIANFFQHIPYLELQINEHGYDFVSVGGVHVEPIGLYSRVHASLEDLPSSLEIIISNSPSDRPRLLGLLQEAGLIELHAETSNQDIVSASLSQLPTLFSSSKTIQFIEVDAPQLYSNYQNRSGDVVLINGNFALDNGLNPLEDALALEGSGSRFVNVVVTRSENEEEPFIQALIEVLQSEDVQQWIVEQYGGAVVPGA